jgi:hypothetical protein
LTIQDSKLSVVGALIRPNTSSLKHEWLQTVIEAFAAGVLSERRIAPENFAPADAVIFVEHRDKAYSVEGTDFKSTIDGEIPMRLLSTRRLSNLIYQHEEGKDEAGVPESASYILLVGSDSFCRLATHYLATGPNGTAGNWGFHLMQLLTSQRKDLLWVERLPNGKMNDLFRIWDIPHLLKMFPCAA